MMTSACNNPQLIMDMFELANVYTRTASLTVIHIFFISIMLSSFCNHKGQIQIGYKTACSFDVKMVFLLIKNSFLTFTADVVSIRQCFLTINQYLIFADPHVIESPLNLDWFTQSFNVYLLQYLLKVIVEICTKSRCFNFKNLS